MKSVAIAMVLVLFAVVALFACPKGSTEWEGTCARDLTPASSTTDSSKWISNEKPPSDKMPSYERTGIRIVTPPPGVEPSANTAHDFKAEGNQQ